ncbi:HAD family phosphatase [Candidatus Curtissbacteria bacterium]|nr:HAD family phosphatase [Candidatus Curtissbacteria bacterium]
MVNTQELIDLSYKEILARKGASITQEGLVNMFGRPGLVNARYIVEKYGLNDKPEEFLEERRKIALDLFDQKMELMEGVVELLENTRRWGIKCAIASSGWREIVMDTLQKYDITQYFDEVITAEDLKTSEGKPDPEVFLITAEKLGVKPEACLVLEDAPNGIVAAKAAGMRSIFVPSVEYIALDQVPADLVLRTLRELNSEVLNALGKERSRN